MWLLSALLLLSLPGCFSIQGPTAVSGPEGGSVTLQCHYDPGWETYRKWWCRGADWKACEILIITTGSEEEIKKARISITDNQENRTFTVTMEDLSREDNDTYWCGIERSGTDLGVQVQVIVGPASQRNSHETLRTTTVKLLKTGTTSSPASFNHRADQQQPTDGFHQTPDQDPALQHPLPAPDFPEAASWGTLLCCHVVEQDIEGFPGNRKSAWAGKSPPPCRPRQVHRLSPEAGGSKPLDPLSE
ncbi:CMRF35-like molecule 7 isoform X2 [Tamandua tetradactyla]|uniref:CMRF35-like molecule 7 isoform X2 n=1 Tax=Tamandua tetradactyla TaxID=48850 RepID=UPI0040546E93